MQCYLSLKREYSMAEYLFTVSDKKLRSTLTRYRLSGAEIVFTLWPESDGNRTALPNRVLQIHRYTNSVLPQNTADPSHIYNSSRPGETSVSARRTQDLLCVCCSICVSLSPQKRRHSVCPELMFPAHVDYIMTYYSFILLKCIFCLCKSNTLSYLILFLTYTTILPINQDK